MNQAGQVFHGGRQQDAGIVGDGRVARLSRLREAAELALCSILNKALDASKEVVFTLASQRNPFPVNAASADISVIHCSEENTAHMRREERAVTSLLPEASIKKCYEMLSRDGSTSGQDSGGHAVIKICFDKKNAVCMTPYLLVHMKAVHRYNMDIADSRSAWAWLTVIGSSTDSFPLAWGRRCRCLSPLQWRRSTCRWH